MIPLVAPTITPADRLAVAAAAYQDGLTSERLVRKFEEAFAERVGCAGAVAVCSGTEALTLALKAAGANRTNVVALPTYACAAVHNAARRIGGTVVLADCSFDIAAARMMQDHGTVLVHSFGRATANGFSDSSVVEDWTLSLGGVPCLVGLLGVCSTHASKMISTGRGGVVFANDGALLEQVRDLAYYDWHGPNGNLGSYSVGMTAIQAALGLSQLKQLDEFIARRREIAAVYSARFDDAGIECPDPDCGSVFFRYLIGVDNPAGKVATLKEIGIEAGRGVYPPLHRQLGLPDDQFPGATAAVNRLLSVPCHPSLTDRDVSYIADQVATVCQA